MAIKMLANGTVEAVVAKNGTEFTLEELQQVVGGYIEAVYLGAQVMWVNEEGRLRDLPLNRNASQVAKQPIVGDVIITSRAEGGFDKPDTDDD